MTEELIDAGAGVVLAVAAGVLAGAVLLGLLVARLLRALCRRLGVAVLGGPLWRSPVVLLVVLLAVQEFNRLLYRPWSEAIGSLLSIAVVAAFAWLLVVLVLMLEKVALARFPADDPGDVRARQIRTQIAFFRRVAVALVVIVAAGVVLWSFPAVRELGIGLLGSAGLLGIIAGLAAQSTLGNVFAGMQIAWTDRIRTGDVVVIDDAWGHIDTITLTYVVVRIWNGTDLILPSTYFTTTPFRNWTHTAPEVIAQVDVVTDWRVPVADVRTELARAAQDSPLWNGRRAELVVADATGTGLVLTAFVSAIDADSVARLQWQVREALVTYLQQHPAAVPRSRHELLAEPSASEGAGHDPGEPADGERQQDERDP